MYSYNKVIHYFKKSLFLATALTLITSAEAQTQNRYSTWSDPNAPAAHSSEMQKLLGELGTLVRDAEQARAADPVFLRDLKDLVQRYQGQVTAPAKTPATSAPSTPRIVLKDDFSDGNFTENPVWTLASGKYWIEQGYGLRSFVDINKATPQPSTNAVPQKLSNEELVIGILGAVLGATPQNQGQNQAQTQTNANTPVEPAVIYHDMRLSNAFQLDLDFSSWTKGGSFSLQTYQGSQRKTGYRLTYRSKQNPSLILERLYSSSQTIVGSVNGINLEDERPHKILWQRDENGVMEILLDGKSLIKINDQGFRDDFSGISLTNNGGDFIVKSIQATGN